MPTMEVSDMDVASLKKLKHTIPVSRYTAKLGISDLNSVEKTMYWTIIVSRGFRKLHRTPRTERLYFVLKSLETSCRMR